MIVPRGPFWWRIGSGVLVLAILVSGRGVGVVAPRPGTHGAWNLGLCRGRLGPGRGPGTSVGEVAPQDVEAIRLLARATARLGRDGPANALFAGWDPRPCRPRTSTCWDVASTGPARRTRPDASGRRPCRLQPDHAETIEQLIIRDTAQRIGWPRPPSSPSGWHGSRAGSSVASWTWVRSAPS